MGTLDKKDVKEELTKKLMETEAQIKKTENEIKQDNKRMKHIEKSKTWRYAKPLQRLFRQSAKQDQAAYIAYLEEKQKQTEQALRETTEKLNACQMDDRRLNTQHMLAAIKEAKEEGTLADLLGKVVEQKQNHEANYNEALHYAGRHFMNEKDAYKHLAYSTILSGLKIEDIPEFMVREGLTDNCLPLRAAASYRASLNMRMRQKQLVGTLPEWLLDNKKQAYAFIDQLGIKRPWISREAYQAATIPRQDGIVIKPEDGAGSRGVYLVYDLNDIVDIKRSKQLHSWKELEASLKQDLKTNWVQHDAWIIEQLVFENSLENRPARDIKFYCFYGRVGVILEIVRTPELKYCWWTADGVRIRTGKYDEDLFMGNGVTQAEIERASAISLQIPAPFIRIDFLRSGEELVFGEFTPKPGNYDEFDKLTDQWLGDYFIEAQGRLTEDFLAGKQFTVYQELTASPTRL